MKRGPAAVVVALAAFARRLGGHRQAIAVLACGWLSAGISSAAAAQEPFRGRLAFQVFAEDQGLGNTAIECLLQDRTGFLWLGTQDGLFRYDGNSFVRFGRAEGLPSSRINALHETADGRLFVATRSGLALREAAGFRAIGAADGLPEAAIDAGIASDRAGQVYVATHDGVFIGAGTRFERLPTVSESPTALWVDPADSLLYALGERLFRRSAAGAVEEIGVSRGLDPHERLDAVVVDRAGSLWARSLSRLWRLDAGAPRFVEVDAGLPASVETGRLALDAQGALLVPTGQGLYQRDELGWRALGVREGLPGATVFSALVDREGTLWLGLAGVGLAERLGDGSIAAWTHADGLAHDVVWAARRATPAGPLWVGTEQGLSRLDADGSVRSFTEKDGLAGNTVYALASDAAGRLWAASWPGGVTRIDLDGRLVRVAAEGLAPADFRAAAIFVDRAGAVWVGTQRGPYRLAPGDTLFRPAAIPGADDERDSVYAFAETEDGVLWAASRYGLQRLAPGAPQRYRRAAGLAADFVSSLIALPGSRLLVGYREALGAAEVEVASDRLVVHPLVEKSPLSFAKVLFAGRDAEGRVWLGGGAGIDVLDSQRRLVRHYARGDGMAGEDMSQNGFFAEPGAGGIWVGTSRGLLHFSPGVPPVPAVPPPIVIVGAWGGSRALHLDAAELLARDERSLRVTWASLSFRSARHVYRYRLLGLDDDETTTTLPEARFAALPSGHYRFEVRAIAPDGAQSDAPATFELDVAKAPWETWWARVAFAALAVVWVVGAVRLRTRALEKDRERLELAVARRTGELATAIAELEEASVTDPLTRLRNRRYFSSVIAEDVAKVVRARHARAEPLRNRDLILYLVDVDRFKQVNDTWGHAVGDEVLVMVASRLSAVVRTEDVVMRWGGEEFLVLARDTERAGGALLASRVLEGVGGRPMPLADGRSLTVTCSVGWAPLPWDLAATAPPSHEESLRQADLALYEAKHAGRDRAVGFVLGEDGSLTRVETGRPAASTPP